MVSFDMSNLVTKFVVKYNVMGNTRRSHNQAEIINMTTLKLHMLLIELMSV